MSEYTWPHAELAAPDLEQPDDARIAVHTPPALPAYSPFWPYTELENRRDKRVYRNKRQSQKKSGKRTNRLPLSGQIKTNTKPAARLTRLTE